MARLPTVPSGFHSFHQAAPEFVPCRTTPVVKNKGSYGGEQNENVLATPSRLFHLWALQIKTSSKHCSRTGKLQAAVSNSVFVWEPCARFHALAGDKSCKKSKLTSRKLCWASPTVGEQYRKCRHKLFSYRAAVSKRRKKLFFPYYIGMLHMSNFLFLFLVFSLLQAA